MMRFEDTAIADARLIHLDRHSNVRGAFVRTWCVDEFKRAGITLDPVQANMSSTNGRGTIRAMHFQHAPKAEAKLLRCISGRVFDVITDLRPCSRSFRASFTVELSEEGAMLYAPPGVAHGFQALTDNVVVMYLMGERYDPELADGFRYDDPAASIAWPLPARMLSERDLAWPPLCARTFWSGGEPRLKSREVPAAVA